MLGQEVRELLGRVPYLSVVYDSYDNALAESVIGLHKSELIQSSRPPTTLSNTWPTRPGTTKSSLYRTRGRFTPPSGIQLDGDGPRPVEFGREPTTPSPASAAAQPSEGAFAAELRDRSGAGPHTAPPGDRATHGPPGKCQPRSPIDAPQTAAAQSARAAPLAP